MNDSGSKPASYPGKILLVDDDKDTRDIYGEFLTEAGFKMDFATDGASGLAKIIQGGYDLILLDIMMTKIDGLGVLQKLKDMGGQAFTYNGPIVVLSALDQQKIIDQALKLGAKGYLVKSGLTPDTALSKISQILQNNPQG